MIDTQVNITEEPEQEQPTRTDRAAVLLVDDRPENLLTLSAALEPLGQRLVTASSGEDALRILLEQDFAVILLDVNLPGLDGYETAALVRGRERTRHTPIIFLTAMDQGEVQVGRAYSLGAVDFLFKPFDIDVLRAKVTVFVDLFLKTREIARLNNDLERRVEQRTRELQRINVELKNEITERRRAEEQIRELNAELEERVRERTAELVAVNQELEAFSYSVSHDLRAPLRRLTGLSRMLLEDHGQAVREDLKGYLDRIIGASRQMNDIIEDLLTLSTITRNDLHCEEVDVSGLVETLAEEIRRGSDHAAEVRIQPDMVARADRRLLMIALRNLLDNAWKFSSRQEKAIIEFGSDSATGAFFIRDNGAGFDMSRAGNLFSPFERLHAGSEFPGTGIGLAIVQRVITKHGGHVWAESTVGKGATFFFTLG